MYPKKFPEEKILLARSDHWYIPGKTLAEKQHIHEHETLQIMQRHALNSDHLSFYNLLLSFSKSQTKRNDVAQMCGYIDSHDAEEKSRM